ncbi:MAG TPA: maleylpyruvate isomerase family mycothiol-dependent enzyme [Acidimicrobiales bacterium]|nr:maleylpyruvate isomerase family mycothiol-dependent enzyme [Acidimicrobiales bacterium]
MNVQSIDRIERIDRKEARGLAEEEFTRFAELAASLSPKEWEMPTDCTAWDVRKMALHVLGSADAQASVREFLHQLRRGVPLNKQIDSHHWVDGLNELQIRERNSLSNAEMVERLKTVGHAAVEGRWKTPPPMRYLPIPFGPPVGWAPLKYLLDVGFTRDVWCHRIDICSAVGRSMRVTPEHDGRLVADVVAEWAGVHGQPFELVLEGPAGGSFSQGVGGERVVIDALEFVRTLAGRRPGDGVLANPLPL